MVVFSSSSLFFCCWNFILEAWIKVRFRVMYIKYMTQKNKTTKNTKKLYFYTILQKTPLRTHAITFWQLSVVTKALHFQCSVSPINCLALSIGPSDIKLNLGPHYVLKFSMGPARYNKWKSLWAGAYVPVTHKSVWLSSSFSLSSVPLSSSGGFPWLVLFLGLCLCTVGSPLGLWEFPCRYLAVL